MKYPAQWRFWYFGELYILLHLCGVTHASWWWVAFFYFIDLNEGIGAMKAGKDAKAAQ